MSLKSETEEYRQPDGLITPRSERPGIEIQDTTGDGLKHFCVYHALLIRRGESQPKDFEEFERVVRSCFVRSGLPHRSPTKTAEQISKDGLMWVAYAAKLLKSRIAWEVLNSGNSTRLLWLKWFYPNLWPRIFDDDVRFPWKMFFSLQFWKCWMGKNPEVVAQLQFCGLPEGHKPHLLRQAWMWVFLCVSHVSKGTVYSLAYACCESARGQNKLGDHFIRHWEHRMVKSGGILKMLTEEYGPDHPIVKYWV